MRKKDKTTDEKIIKVAKTGFLESGYNRVSLRDISKRAGVTTGSIYSRYKSKDDLFYQLCKDTITAMKMIFNDCSSKIDNYNERFLHEASVMKESFYNHEKIITQNLDGLKLLLYKSSGSKLNNYREILIEDYINNAIQKIEVYGSKFKAKPCKISSTSYIYMLIRSLAFNYVAYIEELMLRKSRNISDYDYYAYIDNMSYIIFESFKQIFNSCKTFE